MAVYIDLVLQVGVGDRGESKLGSPIRHRGQHTAFVRAEQHLRAATTGAALLVGTAGGKYRWRPDEVRCKRGQAARGGGCCSRHRERGCVQ